VYSVKCAAGARARPPGTVVSCLTADMFARGALPSDAERAARAAAEERDAAAVRAALLSATRPAMDKFIDMMVKSFRVMGCAFPCSFAAPTGRVPGSRAPLPECLLRVFSFVPVFRITRPAAIKSWCSGKRDAWSPLVTGTAIFHTVISTFFFAAAVWMIVFYATADVDCPRPLTWLLVVRFLCRPTQYRSHRSFHH
jgi:hypothetical protein